MLPYDTDPEQQLTIEAIARARYDGDIDAAYREVLETGLDHTAIPARRAIDSADGTLDHVYYMTAQNRKRATLFHRFVAQYGRQLVTFGDSGGATMTVTAFLEELMTVSQYGGVDHKVASFSIADWDQQWYGWGFANFATALRSTADRTQQAKYESDVPENVSLVFSVNTVTVLVQFTHDRTHTPAQAKDIRIKMYASGEPFEHRKTLSTIVRHFGGSLGAITPFDARASWTLSTLVEPCAYLTDTDGNWVTKIVIDLADVQLKTTPDMTFTPILPERAVVHLSSYSSVATAPTNRYRVDHCTIARLDGGVCNVALRGNWRTRK
ncbi:hypothetical protein [Haladaptatus sp. CMAA 1911]|uniref:hypothetical protein n=1 Tax=unclassified Haladaptatus TaxID=2622732 RepID=UPI003755356E